MITSTIFLYQHFYWV